ncbi:molybdenum ABC transporter permease [Endozoicomonas montiporae]|uniref:Molybdenum transport system permease n=2 Tax=Endozoicomonas montiporae TaxID=1027273 RepID=A0A081N745_9GAMM|nr:molybdate ABC transporter permease subunit [Endozoicomonas montiporae]AMO55914.1 molybdate ABC transporter inner membrane subunit [Endozoicomonas montiporae CL-33]KEQ14268.1 molybdenum ABC transporter permease [Endozoicomonas montiporae]
MLSAAVWLTLKLAFVTTLILMVIGIPLAWKLSTMRSRWCPVIEALVGLPMVLPPTVLGFYLLLAFSPNNPIGQFWLNMTGSTLAFSFSGLVVASVLYSLPFVVQPLQRSFEQLDHGLLEAAAMLGARRLDRFINIVLPNTRRALLLAACMGFAHTIGEFGVVLMIGGNIPGETQVLSIALFDAVETQQFDTAHTIAGGLLAFAMTLLVVLYSIDRRGSLR